MPRARNQLPQALFGLTRNPSTGQYEITRQGVTYQMDMSMMVELKKAFTHQGCATLEAWYIQLSLSDKAKVERTGHNESDDPFYPDPEY